jgi:hypothetical protein
MAKTFDPKCWDLACHFLADIPNATNEQHEELARELQDAAEDFIGDLSCCQACGACPGFIGADCDGTCEHEKAEAA